MYISLLRLPFEFRSVYYVCMYTYSVTVEFVRCNLKVSSQGHVCNYSSANGISYEVFAYEHNVVRTKFLLRILIIYSLIIAITLEI